ncbi:hypothetical protein SISSUDRAFT_1012818 [Sistotremastrum suecicum HHB10207 ss-3]|uniref:DNA mismatch repair proteins mutS family domain-containing protein n=1 Tax=Sistotremastrum suecicum HHB10207 ss-3 TaxID=1314776 RepID=A0A166JBW6_9AGAM|nr:hypothetical protein SISSUDRAFT_1012818 [Sistotremastrum suecicum HHB10207 ss-3]
MLAIEILENLARFPHCILLTRVGQFYESYFDQAAEVAQLLTIKLTSRKWDKQEVLMAGFPIMHLDRHLKTLIQVHKRPVAMCEEFRREDQPDKFNRRVVRILTPGTLIDESFVNQYQDNYLLAINLPLDSRDADDLLGLAWIDVSTGEFFSQKSSLNHLEDDVARIAPREIVLPSYFEPNSSHPVVIASRQEGCPISFATINAFPSDQIPTAAPASDDVLYSTETPGYSQEETAAVRLLMSFLRTNLLEHMTDVTVPARHKVENRMEIDAHTIRALEIRENMREGGSSGSLTNVLKRTITSSGTRLFSRWLTSPSTSIPEIIARQDLVSLFLSRPHFRRDLRQLFREVADASRIVQKFLLGRGDSDDLLHVNKIISSWSMIGDRIASERDADLQHSQDGKHSDWENMDRLLARMTRMEALAESIDSAVDDPELRRKEALSMGADDPLLDGEESQETPFTNTGLGRPPYGQRWRIKPTYSQSLQELHARLTSLMYNKERMQSLLQRKYGAPSLTLRASPSLGLHVHLSKMKRDRTKLTSSTVFIPLHQSNTTQSFVYPQRWTQLGTAINQVTAEILAAEKLAFESLRGEVIILAAELRKNARVVDELDVTCAFAELAAEMKLVRPIMTTEPVFNVENGRHPTVELSLLSSGRNFTPNTTLLTESSRLHIITGPNMAGKSTLLRQTALIAILAQTGSFVPADFARIGIVDKVFSRVGARDDLFRNRSTFMVEMLETADILTRATASSLVIMDEVGRGTTVKDGLAIAFATAHHLYSINKSRALFATHFHELADMFGYSDECRKTGAFKDMDFYCSDIDETDDDYFSYSHRVRPGVNRDSHGIRVARLGGMPPSAIQTATSVLEYLRGTPDYWHAGPTKLQQLGIDLARANPPSITNAE